MVSEGAKSGAIAGAMLGKRLLQKLPDHVYRLVVAVLLIARGIFMLMRGIQQLLADLRL
jgi:uncharacterized membrane protein YfcA